MAKKYIDKNWKKELTDEELDAVLKDGAKWAVEHKYGIQEDLDHCEEQGTMPGADPNKVSPRAKARGRKQLGTLGAGNHFLEVQVVDEIYDKDIIETITNRIPVHNIFINGSRLGSYIIVIIPIATIIDNVISMKIPILIIIRFFPISIKPTSSVHQCVSAR